MSRYFTRDEAERLLPELEKLLREALSLKSQYQESDEAIKKVTRDIMMRGGMAVDSDQMRAWKQRSESAAVRLQAILERVQEQGCLIKDLDIGLLDFPTLYNGREVYLCWRLGESRIEYWHGVEEGFRGRKPIDETFLARHSNS